MTIQPTKEPEAALFVGRKDREKRVLHTEVLSMKYVKKPAHGAFKDAGTETGRRWCAGIAASERSTQLLGDCGERLACGASFAAHLKDQGDTGSNESRTGLIRASFVEDLRRNCGIIASTGSISGEAQA